jgi:hypothetical protein
LTLNGEMPLAYMFLKIIKKWCRPIKNPLINQDAVQFIKQN